MTIEQIITKVKKNNPKKDVELLKLAYDFAEKAHKGQKRQTGEPYIQHSLHTAFILAQMKADINTIIAGILHDIPEDTKHTLGEIEKAILKSDLGLNPQNDGKVIRISLPPLSEERRKELVKIVKRMAEEGRISIRSIDRKSTRLNSSHTDITRMPSSA